MPNVFSRYLSLIFFASFAWLLFCLAGCGDRDIDDLIFGDDSSVTNTTGYDDLYVEVFFDSDDFPVYTSYIKNNETKIIGDPPCSWVRVHAEVKRVDTNGNTVYLYSETECDWVSTFEDEYLGRDINITPNGIDIGFFY